MSYTLLWKSNLSTEENLSWDELVDRLGDEEAVEDALAGIGAAEAWYEQEEDDDNEPYLDPVQADADTLAMAGMGTDEDYGYFGGDEW